MKSKYPSQHAWKIRNPHHPRWLHMLGRCYDTKNKDFLLYGGRGIRVCQQWKNFISFQEWCFRTYTPGKMLDRSNNAKGYNPNNCRWVTPIESAQNRRWTERQKVAAKIRAEVVWHRRYGNPLTRKNKFCPKCKEFKSTVFFNKSTRAPDGLQGYCRGHKC